MAFIFKFYAIIDTKINLFAHKNTLVTFNLHKILYIPIRCIPTTNKPIWYIFYLIPQTFYPVFAPYLRLNAVCMTAAIHIVRRPSNACTTVAVH